MQPNDRSRVSPAHARSNTINNRARWSLRSGLMVLVVMGLAAISQPAYASWAWADGLVWTYSAVDCTSPGQAFNQVDRGPRNTAASVTCNFANASASAFQGWGGGSGAGNATNGSFGPILNGPASAGITTPPFAVSTTGITFNGMGTASESGMAFLELGAFIYTGDPNQLFGSLTGPADIEDLINMGLITQSDVLLNLQDANIPSSFTSLSFTKSIDPSQEQDVFLLGYGSGASSTPEPSSFLLLGSGVLGLGCLLRRRLPRD